MISEIYMLRKLWSIRNLRVNPSGLFCLLFPIVLSQSLLLIVLRYPNYGPAAHGTDLSLQEPASKALLMKYMLTVGYLHYGLPWELLKLFQADTAVIVFGGILIEDIGLKEGHVGLHDFLSLDVVKFLIGLVMLPVPVLGDEVANDRETEKGQCDSDQDWDTQ